MSIRWSHLAYPICAGAVGAWLGSVAFWDVSKQPILTVLSVIAAGVLVRLARGLPFTNSEQIAVDEVRQIAAATIQSVRALRALIVVVFISMGNLIFAAPLSAFLTTDQSEGGLTKAVGPALSGIVAFLLAYVLVRLWAVIEGDVSLVGLQTNLLVKAVERKQSEKFEKAQSRPSSTMISNPEDYGKIIQ